MALLRRSKNTNKPLIGQISDLIPVHILTSEIAKHQSDKGKSTYKTRDQLVALTFGPNDLLGRPLFLPDFFFHKFFFWGKFPLFGKSFLSNIRVFLGIFRVIVAIFSSISFDFTTNDVRMYAQQLGNKFFSPFCILNTP